MSQEKILVIKNLTRLSWKRNIAIIIILPYIFGITTMVLINSFKLSSFIIYSAFILGLMLVSNIMIDQLGPNKIICYPTEVKLVFSKVHTESYKADEISLILKKEDKSERYFIEKSTGERFSYLLDRKQGKALEEWFKDTISVENKTTNRK